MNRCLFIFLLTTIPQITWPQPNLKFENYGTREGLVHSNVLTICQDNLGFLWFGTKYGCSRFDGTEFKAYQYDENNPASIDYGQVNQIICDNKNRLWFALAGTGNTLMKYDYETDKFTDVSETIKEQLNVKDKVLNFWNIYSDSDGYIWFAATNTGFAFFNPETNKVKVFSEQVVSPQRPRSFFEDVDKNIWIATAAGVFVYNKKTDSFTIYQHDPDNPLSLSSNNCNKVFQDSKRNIWIGTYKGLNKLILSSSSSFSFEHYVYDPKNPFTLSSNLIYNIVEDDNNNLLIATVNGLCLMDNKTRKIYRYFSDELDNESINSNLVHSILRDNQDNIWIATNSGIGKLQVKNFKSFTQSFYENSISHSKVQYLCESYNSDVWIATPKGIDVFNKKKKEFYFLAGVTQNEKGLYGAPLTFCPDKDKGMWIGTWNGGLSHFDYASNKFTNYIIDTSTQLIDNIFSIFLDSKNNLWVSVNGRGIYVYNTKTEQNKFFSYDGGNPNTLSSSWTYTIIEDSDSDTWIGTLDGLNLLLDFKTGSFKTYLAGVVINHIIESSNKYLWLGTNKGLYRFDKRNQEFKNFGLKDGVPGKSVFSILEDSSQNLWITTEKGLSRFKLLNDSVPEIINYHREDGIAIGEFLERSCIKLSDGTMLFGGTKGFCMFQPTNVKTDTLFPKIVFTSLKIANKVIKANEKINGQTILKKSISTTDRLELNHKNNTFSIEFSGLQYNMPRYNQYCYRLEGFDEDNLQWHYTDASNRKIEYMNLPPGNYALKLKGANSYGIWNNKATELAITISPPWQLTFWAISLMIILFILLIIVIVRIRTYSLRKQKQKLEKIVEQRTTELKEMNVVLREGKEELESQMEQMAKMNENLEAKTTQIENMAKQLHEADQLKLEFFANISHEFRTPLTLIIGPLEKCLSLEQPIYWNKVNLSAYLQLMHKNTKRLFRLINQVIDFRKIERGSKQLNISNNNIVEFTEEVVNVFSTLVEQKNINLKIESQFPTINFKFDPDVMEKILYNLISNAIKYTPEGGEVSVQLTVNSNQSAVNSYQLSDNEKLENENADDNKLFILNSSLLIKVVDTGIGISKENLDKIFNRFYRVETKEGFTEGGTGIGLTYTKELVELHKGTIFAESQPGKGSSFILEFPISKEISKEETTAQESTLHNLDYTRSMINLKDEITEIKTEEQNINNSIESDLQEKRSNILIVEDNNDLRKFIKSELSSHFNVYEAENGEKGLKLANQIEPELIISDVMMPIMNGIELCKRIKSDENTSHIPLILLTAKGSDEDQIKGLETGADDYIPKPFNINILKIKINNLFLLRKRIQEKFNKSINVEPSEIASSLIDQQFIQKAIDVVNKNMHNYEFDNDAFVKLMNYSRTQVYKKIKSITGQSISDFIRSIKLKAAAKLFLEGNFNITDVSYKTGFKHPNTFSRYFSEMFGKPPREFIKEISIK